MTTKENKALVGRLAFEEVTFPNDGLHMTAFMLLLSLKAVSAASKTRASQFGIEKRWR